VLQAAHLCFQNGALIGSWDSQGALIQKRIDRAVAYRDSGLVQSRLCSGKWKRTNFIRNRIRL